MPRHKYVRLALFVCLGVIAAGVYSSAAEEKEKRGAQAPNAKARRDAAKMAYEGSFQHHLEQPEGMPGEVGYFHDWSVRWMQAERDLSQTKAERIAAVEGHLKRMQFWKELLDAKVKEGEAPKYTASAGEFFHLEAEDWLTAARAERK
jgi:hypothetical protein